ncbi:hypothetical protein KQH50_01465 [bacterium]|nr:hypothetical protein [bacterium]
MKKLSKPARNLLIGLIMILVGSFLASMLQTNFYNVRVKDFTIGTEQQQTLHALAFIPKECTAANPCPLVVTSHGWLNSAEVQDAASIELSRRGIVVISMDAITHGMSSNNTGVPGRDTAAGMISWVEYATSGLLDYVDLDRVGVMGHSMGGLYSWTTLDYYGNLYFNAIEEAKLPDSDGGEEITPAEQAYADSLDKIWAGLPTGNAPRMVTEENNSYASIHANLGVLLGRYEEGGDSRTTGNSDIRGESKEAYDLINYPNGVLREDPITYVEEGVFYGNKEDKTLRVLYNPVITHPLIHFDPGSTKDVIQFFTYTFDINTSLSAGNQLFFIKELLNFVAMIGLFVIMVPLAQILMDHPAFEELQGEEGPKVPGLTTAKAKRRWSFGILLTGAVSFLTALLTWVIYDKIFTAGFMSAGQFWFPIPTANNVMTWTALMAIWSFFWFWFNYKRDEKEGLRTQEMIGWKISSKEFWKTLGLATLVIAVVYSIVWFCKWLFNTDFRIWTPAIKTFNPDKLLYFFQYWPVFFAFYLANSLLINGAMRVEGMKESKNLFLLGIANIIGPGLIVLVQYIPLFVTHNETWSRNSWTFWIDPLVIGFTVFVLFPAPYLLRAFYKATGKNWLGPIVYSVMAVMILVMHNAIYGLFF